jgi:hypothetical protein
MSMRLTINEEGIVQIDLEPADEQVIVTIGPAEVWCLSGTMADPGTGPLGHVVVTDQAAQTVVDSHQVRVGYSSLEVPCSPLEESDEPHEP